MVHKYKIRRHDLLESLEPRRKNCLQQGWRLVPLALLELVEISTQVLTSLEKLDHPQLRYFSYSAKLLRTGEIVI